MIFLPAISRGNAPTATNWAYTTYSYTDANPPSRIYPATVDLSATCTISGGVVQNSVVISNGGANWGGCSIGFSGGGGSGATATATVTNGVITAITITNGGSGYSSAPTIIAWNTLGAISASTLRLREYTMMRPNNVDASNCRGIVLVCNAVDSDYRAAATYAGLVEWCARMKFVAIGTKHMRRMEPINESVSDTPQDGPDWLALTAAISSFATASSIPNLIYAPFCAFGYSAGGQIAWGLARAAPERTICSMTGKGGFYGNYNSSMKVVPMIYFAGETDTLSRRQNITGRYVGLDDAYNYPTTPARAANSLWCWCIEANTAHVWGNMHDFMLAYFEEAVALRYPGTSALSNAYPTLVNLNESDGWLVDQGTTNWSTGFTGIRPFAGYSGDATICGWVPNEKVARLYRATASYISSATVDSRKRVSCTTQPFNTEVCTKLTKDKWNDITFTINDSISDWTKLEVYDGTTLMGTYYNTGSSTITHPVWGDGNRNCIPLYGVLTRPSETSTSCVAVLVVTA